MNREETKLSERLLAVEPLSPESSQKLQQELHAMFIRRLNLPSRIFMSVVGVAAFSSAMVCGFLAVTEANLPTLARVGLAVGTLFGLAWAALAARIVRRGVMDLKFDNRLIAAMVWVFTILMMMFFLAVGMSAEDRLLGVMLILNGLVFLIGAAVHFLTFRIEQAELSTREKLLELELRLAELCEKR